MKLEASLRLPLCGIAHDSPFEKSRNRLTKVELRHSIIDDNRFRLFAKFAGVREVVHLGELKQRGQKGRG